MAAAVAVHARPWGGGWREWKGWGQRRAHGRRHSLSTANALKAGGEGGTRGGRRVRWRTWPSPPRSRLASAPTKRIPPVPRLTPDRSGGWPVTWPRSRKWGGGRRSGGRGWMNDWTDAPPARFPGFRDSPLHLSHPLPLRPPPPPAGRCVPHPNGRGHQCQTVRGSVATARRGAGGCKPPRDDCYRCCRLLIHLGETDKTVTTTKRRKKKPRGGGTTASRPLGGRPTGASHGGGPTTNKREGGGKPRKQAPRQETTRGGPRRTGNANKEKSRMEAPQSRPLDGRSPGAGRGGSSSDGGFHTRQAKGTGGRRPSPSWSASQASPPGQGKSGARVPGDGPGRGQSGGGNGRGGDGAEGGAAGRSGEGAEGRGVGRGGDGAEGRGACQGRREEKGGGGRWQGRQEAPAAPRVVEGGRQRPPL